MSAYSTEEMVLEGQMEVKELFEFVKNNAEAMDAYSMEQSIFSRIRRGVIPIFFKNGWIF